jgi:predicted lipid-binding transport protein (Tim44 family)
LILNWWQRRNGYATAGGPSLRDMPQDNAPRGHAYAGAVMSGGEPLTITEADFNMFEQRLGDIQTAYAGEDIGKLRSLVTPEMLSYFSEELADNASRGLVNEMSDVKLLQGDLAESWREGTTDYATVAMRYELSDAMVERESGRVVEGSRDKQEVTELWTFMRSRGGAWLLSAIQQT